MTWIDDGLAREDERAWILRHADEGLQLLQAEITKRIQELQDKTLGRKAVNVSCDEITMPGRDGGVRKLQPKLSANRLAIQASGASGVTIDLARNGNAIGFRHKGAELSVEEVARLILEPFFFPEVTPKP